VDGAFEYCCFSSKLFCLIILWESNVYFLLLFQSCANELLFESRNEGMGAKGQRIIFSSAAVERNAVYRTFEVKCNGISVCCRTILYIDGSCIFLLLFFQLSFYFFICNGCVSFCYFQTFVLAKGNFRFYCYSCGKDESFAFFDLLYVDLRTGYDVQFALFCCFGILFRNKAVYSILIEYCRAIHFFYHSSRNFSFTEARNADVLFLFLVSFLQCFL